MGLTTASSHFVGRFDFSDPEGPLFNWSGNSIETTFVGDSVSITLDNLETSEPIYFSIMIDSEKPYRLKTEAGRKTYKLSENLIWSDHYVKIVRESEAKYGVTRFLGFEVGAGEQISQPRTSKIRIETIGDSITCGYGLLEQDPCTASSSSQSMTKTYGALAANILNAEYSSVCFSGKGVFHNWGRTHDDPTQTTLLEDYTQTLAGKNIDWNFPENQRADVVVINLGTNDFSNPVPTEMEFRNAYTKLVKLVRKNHPRARIFLAIGPVLLEPSIHTVRTALTRVKKAFNESGDQKIHIIEFPNQLRPTACEQHPSPQTHQRMAEQLVRAIH